ncbi:hypothetical protein QQX98_012753 [Neonectria punicea]|uniref:Heterokaryon incompatibility domain-containing protein n=1 Tax=Neonectria punicea TaxID=979145 RepID=A0ABR1GI31_9HYPO
MGFKYGRSLRQNELRLLRPFSLCNDRLSFRVSVSTRESAPGYTAVSYTWGDDAPTETIYLDGKPFRVRPNLWSCLYYLGRNAQSSAFLCMWVDAICINQSDSTERNAQVTLMDVTYKNASFVSVWLGLIPFPEDLQSQVPNQAPIKTVESDGFDWMDAVDDVANRPYWSRFWVIQEFLLGKDVILYCGNHGINWQDFQDMLCREAGVSLFGDIQQPNPRLGPPKSFDPLPLVMGRTPDKHPEMLLPLHDLLISHHKSKYKDPRDRIFALMGLITAEERDFMGRFFPDYRISEDGVVILTLAHLMLGILWQGSHDEAITANSTEIFLGLGVESKSKRRRLCVELEELITWASTHPVLLLKRWSLGMRWNNWEVWMKKTTR